MITVKLTTTEGQVKQMVAEALSVARKKAIAVLAKAGQEAVNMARSHTEKSGNDWHDQTANLRSSIGYLICENGVPLVEGEFKQEAPTATEGPSTGRSYAQELASSTHGLALVVVAGMKYAVYVADKGYDVLSSAQILAKMRIPELFKGMAEYDKNR